MPVPQAIQALPTVLARLETTYPNARYELNWETPVQLLVATILAAQCTDERVNRVTPGLFAKYPDAAAYANAPLAELEVDLEPTGFYRQKAKTVQAVCRDLVERFGGDVPPRMDDLVTLPGVGRKTANVVLNNHFRIPSGVIVDTHVQRVAQRMGLTDQTRPEKIEQDLMKLVPQDKWVHFGPAMVLLGRYTCMFKNPACADCVMADLCPKRIDTEAPEADPSEEDPEPMATKKKAPPAKKAGPARKKAAPRSESAPAPAPAAKSLRDLLPADWQQVLAAEFTKPYFKQLEKFVAQERAAHTVFPPEADVFNAFSATPFEAVKVLLLGQDPYHDDGQAHGMCFSVRPGVKTPPSLVNMFKELHDDLGIDPAPHGHLAAWASQGVMLLNASLTVRAHEPASHKERGWETFTDAVILALDKRDRPAVFLLWGAFAQKKAALIDGSKHRVLQAAHPSPLSAKKFFGSKPFSGANQVLQDLGLTPVEWRLPADPTAALPTPAARPPATLGKPKAEPAKAEPAKAAPKPTPAPAPAPETPAVLEGLLPADWRGLLGGALRTPSFRALDKFLAAEFETGGVCPGRDQVFRAFQLTPLRELRAVIVGTEPPADNSADGLALSVRDGARATSAQKALFRAMRDEIGCRLPAGGSLEPWACQGVLLLNGVLTTRKGKPGAHKGKGWEPFVEVLLAALATRPITEEMRPVVFALWGADAQRYRPLLTGPQHGVSMAPSVEEDPQAFLNARPFGSINDALEMRGRSRIHWQLPYV